MNSELGIRNSELGKCHPERNAVRRGVEGSIRLVGALVALVMTFLTACTDYQEEFDNNFAALEYGDIENPELSSGVDPGSSHGTTPASSASVSSGADPLSSGTVPTSSGAEPLSSGTVPTQSSGEQPSSSAESSSSVESSSSSILPYTPPSGPNYDTLDYNGQKYRTVKIGDQEWMAENMNAKVDGSACYRDSSKYCDMYGRLYSWDAAMKVCPEGWRLPDTTDWSILFESVGGKATAATHLKATSGWTSDGNGDDKFGFSAFAAGGSDTGSDVKYAGKEIDAAFWTSEVKNSYDAWSVGMYWDDSYPTIDGNLIASRRSVRCIKGEPSSSSSVNSSSSSAEPSSSYVPPSGISYGKMTDPSTFAFSYRTVEIGNRTWMAENMAKGGGILCPGGIHENCATYGHLYRWDDAKNLCPEGWSLPSKDEWEQLISSVGGGSAKQAGKALKTNSGWKNDGDGTDEYGFSALPAGYWSNYSGDGEYYGLEGAAHFWSQTEFGSDSAYGLKLEYTVDSASMSKYSVTGKNDYALSVRCILDENYFVDNRDGKTYRKVKIGDQTWMAQNLNYKGEGKDTIGYCYGKNSANCNTYGRLYPIEETIEKGSVCPDGWHLPDTTEWFALFSAVDGKETAATHLNSTSGWTEPGNGDDKFGFSALPGGRGAASGSFFDGEKQNAWFLSKTQCQITDCEGEYFTANFVYSLPNAAFSDFPGTTSVSVRCLKDAE